MFEALFCSCRLVVRYVTVFELVSLLAHQTQRGQREDLGIQQNRLARTR